VVAVDKKCCDGQVARHNSRSGREEARSGVFERDKKPLCQWIVPKRFRNKHISTHVLAVVPRKHE
jgi:hypothetical protein